MTTTEKLNYLKTLLKITDIELDTELSAYIELSKSGILNWLYNGKTPKEIVDVPAKYEITQIMACVAGFSMSGAEGQLSHSENGISRSWKHEDMIAYIRTHIYPQIEVF